MDPTPCVMIEIDTDAVILRGRPDARPTTGRILLYCSMVKINEIDARTPATELRRQPFFPCLDPVKIEIDPLAGHRSRQAEPAATSTTRTT